MLADDLLRMSDGSAWPRVEKVLSESERGRKPRRDPMRQDLGRGGELPAIVGKF